MFEVEYRLELGVSQELSIGDLITKMKYMLRREFKVYDIDIRIMGVEPNVVTAPTAGLGTQYIMRILRLLVKIPVTVNDPKIFYDIIKKFTDSDNIILLTRY